MDTYFIRINERQRALIGWALLHFVVTLGHSADLSDDELREADELAELFGNETTLLTKHSINDFLKGLT